MTLRRRGYMVEGEGKEWIVRVNDRVVQWGVNSYNRLFGKENVSRGMSYAIVKASSEKDALEKFAAHKSPGKRLNTSYFMATPKKGEKTPAPHER